MRKPPYTEARTAADLGRSASTVLAFPKALVIIDASERYLETRFFDGTSVPALAEDTPENVARAAELGYTGEDPVWEMTRDHDLWHSWLAAPDVSPVLWGLAHPDQKPEGWRAAMEESDALDAAQHQDKARPRPWERADNRHGVRSGLLLWGWPDNADGGESTRHQWVDVYHGPDGLGTEVPDDPGPVEGDR